MKKLLAACLLVLAACTSQYVGLVGTVEFHGDGKVWSDGNVTVAIGSGSASMGVYGKATGFPFILPVPSEIAEGTVRAVNVSTGEDVTLELGRPLPAWAATVFYPGEAQQYGITFQDPLDGAEDSDQPTGPAGETDPQPVTE